MREKLAKDGEVEDGGRTQGRGLVSDKRSGRGKKPQVKDKRIISQKAETGFKKCKRIVRKGKTNNRAGGKFFKSGLSPFPSIAGT